MRFKDLTQEMILEGAIDPKRGTQFALIQIEGDMTPFRDLSEIAEIGTMIVAVGFPDPIESGFEDIVSRIKDDKEGE